MKTRITAVILSFALIFALSGCQTERNGKKEVKESVDSSFSESSKHSASSNSEESSQSPAESLPSQSYAEESDTEITASAASELENSEQSTSSAEEKPTQTAEPTKPPIKVEQPEEKPSPEPTQTEPPTVSQPEPPIPEPEPTFDISYWISFAQSYAESNGLVLNSEAVECWDNPIGAGAHCKYLERDIKSRLNRYAKDEDVTDVWIWAESTGSETYDIFIGYA